MEKKVYVGSYTGPEKGKGIYYCLLDTETGALRRISVEEQCENPNFIAVNWKKKILCALNESDKGIWLSSYEIQDDGFLCYLVQDVVHVIFVWILMPDEYSLLII